MEREAAGALLASVIAAEDKGLYSHTEASKKKILQSLSTSSTFILCFIPQMVFLPLTISSLDLKASSCPFSLRHLSSLCLSWNLKVFPHELALLQISLSGRILNLCLLLNCMEEFWIHLGWMTPHNRKCHCQQENPFSHSENCDKGGLPVLHLEKSPAQRNKSLLCP